MISTANKECWPFIPCENSCSPTTFTYVVGKPVKRLAECATPIGKREAQRSFGGNEFIERDIASFLGSEVNVVIRNAHTFGNFLSDRFIHTMLRKTFCRHFFSDTMDLELVADLVEFIFEPNDAGLWKGSHAALQRVRCPDNVQRYSQR